MTPAEIEALLAALQVEHTGDLSKCPGCRAEWEWQAKSKEAAESLLAENARLRLVYVAARDLRREWNGGILRSRLVDRLCAAVDAYLAAEDA